jgi:hypothetical protein
MVMLTAYAGVIATAHIGRLDAAGMAYCVLRLRDGRLIDFHSSQPLADLLLGANQQRLCLYVMTATSGHRSLVGACDANRLLTMPRPTMRSSWKLLLGGILLLPAGIGFKWLREASATRATRRALEVIDLLHPSVTVPQRTETPQDSSRSLEPAVA